MSSKFTALKLNPNDTIAVLRQATPNGALVEVDDGKNLLQTLTFIAENKGRPINALHKISLAPQKSGGICLRYGQPIGKFTNDVPTGGWVHVHNLSQIEITSDLAFCSATPPAPSSFKPDYWMGYRRKDGRAASRSWLLVISSVNCSGDTAVLVRDEIRKSGILEKYPEIHGICVLPVTGGCGYAIGGISHTIQTRIMNGYATHPNVIGWIGIGLGCETNNLATFRERHSLVQLGLHEAGRTSPQIQLPYGLNIQENGGPRKTADRAIGIINDNLPELAHGLTRVQIPMSEAMIGLNCGGSDGASGVTANPALGFACDLAMDAGARCVLAETPELYGFHHNLTRRARTTQIAQTLIDKLNWWKDYAASHGEAIDHNPSSGNLEGGITTIFEKSLGAGAKGGTRHALEEVVDYGMETTAKHGLIVMDTPGFDAPSVVALTSGHCHNVVFTTGRGSCSGNHISPMLKIATNTAMFNRLPDDMDHNSGTILDGTESLDANGARMYELIKAHLSGQPSTSERQGFGDSSIVLWDPGFHC